MKIVDIQIFKYRLPLTREVTIKGTPLLSREGAVIQISSDDGFYGLGEIAPLPGYSLENFSRALEETERLKAGLLQQSVPKETAWLQGAFEKWLGKFSMSASVRFGFEMAILNLFSCRFQKPLHQMLHAHCQDQICLHGLLQGSPQEVKAQAAGLLAAGFTALKMKVEKNIDEEVENVRAVSRVINGRALLHLDANQAWNLEEAAAFGNAIGCASVVYIEEPLSDVTQIPEFFERTMIPVAVDESLMKFSMRHLQALNGVDVFVLKPTMLGGIEKTWLLMCEARRLGLETVVSSSFESGLGILMLANLSGCSSGHGAAGLDTLKWFRDDLLLQPLRVERGKMNIRGRMMSREDIRMEMLVSK